MEGEQECTYEQCSFLFVRLQRNHEVEKIAQPIWTRMGETSTKMRTFQEWNLKKPGGGHPAEVELKSSFWDLRMKVSSHFVSSFGTKEYCILFVLNAH